MGARLCQPVPGGARFGSHVPVQRGHDVRRTDATHLPAAETGRRLLRVDVQIEK